MTDQPPASDASSSASSEPARIGIVTASDRASRGEYEDRGGPAIHAYLDEVLDSPGLRMPESSRTTSH
jgi:molybdopterin biosynthesis enzyme MoaB